MTGFRVPGLKSFRVEELKSFRVEELKGSRVSGASEEPARVFEDPDLGTNVFRLFSAFCLGVGERGELFGLELQGFPGFGV